MKPLMPFLVTSLMAVFTLHSTQAADSLPAYYIGYSDIKITEKGFDFGEESFIAGAPTYAGEIYWYLIDGKISISLLGYLHLDDVRELCGRMRLDYYGGKHVLISTEYGGQVCADDDKHHSWSVGLNPYSNSKINEVKVSIEKLTATKDWTIVGSQSRKLSAVHDKVKIAEDGFDFGGKSLIAGVPSEAGDMAWSWDGVNMVPHLTGWLHINNSATACARVHLKYLDKMDDLLTDKYSGKFCAASNDHYVKKIDMSPYTDPRIASVRVSIQTLGTDGQWHTAGGTGVGYLSIPAQIELTGGVNPEPDGRKIE